jgi:hypothetical protein
VRRIRAEHERLLGRRRGSGVRLLTILPNPLAVVALLLALGS